MTLPAAQYLEQQAVGATKRVLGTDFSKAVNAAGVTGGATPGHSASVDEHDLAIMRMFGLTQDEYLTALAAERKKAGV
ncbi:MAG: hypothetical protein ABI673_02570 [Novosphingobium sp.]